MILLLLRLRYRLLWARLRSRNGKIALFMVGYLFACLVAALLALGGFGAASAAVRIGKAELVARIVFGGFFGVVTVSAVILGIGVSPAFSESALRRYPLSHFERLAARQFTGILEPLWILVFALDLGVAIGFGAGTFALPAALLLVLANYLLARVLSGAVEWASSTPAGLIALAVAVSALILLVSMGPVVFGPALRRSPVLITALNLTPPFAAAAIVSGAPALPSLYRMLLLAGWCLAMAGALAALERIPARSRAIPFARAAWDGPCDRVAAFFGETGPLLSKTLRYYLRSTRGRLNYLLNVPAFVLVLATNPHDRAHPLFQFFLALGVMAIAGFSATFNVSINVFGYDGSGFRRYFLLPVPPGAVIRAALLAPLLLGAPVIPVALLACFWFSRVPVDARMAVMLVSNAISGLLLFTALALWISLLRPSRTRLDASFQNDYSLAANLVGQGAMLGTLFGTMFLGLALDARLLLYWWAAPLVAAGAVVFSLFTLRAAPAVFRSRRERILAVLEQHA